jgi:hypothetical protein
MALLPKSNFSNPCGRNFAKFTAVALLAASLAGCGGSQNQKPITITIPDGIPAIQKEGQQSLKNVQPLLNKAQETAKPFVQKAGQAAKQRFGEAANEIKKMQQIECTADLPKLTNLDENTPPILKFKIYTILNGVSLKITQNTDHANRSGWVFTLPDINNRFSLDKGSVTTNLTSNGDPLTTMSSPNGQTIRFFDANGKDAGVATLTCSKATQVISEEVTNFIRGLGDRGNN